MKVVDRPAVYYAPEPAKPVEEKPLFNFVAPAEKKKEPAKLAEEKKTLQLCPTGARRREEGGSSKAFI